MSTSAAASTDEVDSMSVDQVQEARMESPSKQMQTMEISGDAPREGGKPGCAESDGRVSASGDAKRNVDSDRENDPSVSNTVPISLGHLSLPAYLSATSISEPDDQTSTSSNKNVGSISSESNCSTNKAEDSGFGSAMSAMESPNKFPDALRNRSLDEDSSTPKRSRSLKRKAFVLDEEKEENARENQTDDVASPSKREKPSTSTALERKATLDTEKSEKGVNQTDDGTSPKPSASSENKSETSEMQVEAGSSTSATSAAVSEAMDEDASPPSTSARTQNAHPATSSGSDAVCPSNLPGSDNERPPASRASTDERPSALADTGSSSEVVRVPKPGEISTITGRPADFFVKDWEFLDTLGDGAYGSVKMAYNHKTREAVAIKIVHTNGNQAIKDDVHKEATIHRMLNHRHIIKFFGVRKEGDTQYLFLEYISHGELFDKIAPDVGMEQGRAQKYFRQLMSAVEYLHEKGVTHRDIKPENLLIDKDDNLKMCDFGLATVFQLKSRTRYMERMCGSEPYVAPEALVTPVRYRAQPADLWSCGIVLVAMLAGELPWHRAVAKVEQYDNWRECRIELNPWCKIDNLALCLLRKMLHSHPDRRATMQDIKNSSWFKKDFTQAFPHRIQEALRHRDLSRHANVAKERRTLRPITCSQPITSSERKDRTDDRGEVHCGSSPPAEDDRPISFSQPNRADDMLLSSQLNSTQSSSQTPMQKLVKRMTRFFSKKPRQEVIEELERVFTLLGYTHKKNSSYMITVSTLDKRQNNLTFKATLLEMGESLLVDFRLSRGDGLEFKRHFTKIREHMKPITCKVPSSFPNMTFS